MMDRLSGFLSSFADITTTSENYDRDKNHE
jgi:hypothetical protein